ncbi:MAG TPA: hypothetical protein VFM38_09280 [Candidatus Limnocylindrales bacterium]|nr:hypothetical protein [Candidatus Limnocylindrales bacterium]
MRFTRFTVAPLVAALVLSACQGQAVKTLDDPREILAAAATTAAAATSVHLDLTAKGTVTLDPLGTGASAPIDLSGSTISADLDLQNAKTHATFSAPGLLGLAGEVIVADAIYLKSTLTGPKYRSLPLSGEPQHPLKGLTDLLARTDLQPSKGADAPCAGGNCYTLTMKLTPDDLGGLIGGGGGGGAVPSGLPIPIPVPDVSDATVDLTLHIEQASNRLSDATAVVDLGDNGKLTLQGTFTKWNEGVQITPPPADQVEPAG